jgi:hypothetical protein
MTRIGRIKTDYGYVESLKLDGSPAGGLSGFNKI